MRTLEKGQCGRNCVGAMGHNHVRVYSRLKNANLMAVSDLMKGTRGSI